MLGVNLKQCYAKGAGVYTDFMVPGGSADRSGVVRVGDIVVAVGDDDSCGRKGTIATVPQQIAAAKRPVHLVLATSGAHGDGCGDYLTHVDVCVAVLHSVQTKKQQQQQQPPNQQGKQSSAETKTTSGNDPDDSYSSDAEMEVLQTTSFEEAEDNPQHHPTFPVPDITFEQHEFVDAIVNPGCPPSAVRQAYQAQAAQRNTDVAFADCEAAAASNASLRAALRNAFLLCVADGRRFPFFARYLQRQQEQSTVVVVDTRAAAAATVNDGLGPSYAPGSHSMLLLFWEMFNYVHLHGVTPAAKQRAVAQTIARKFFLPTALGSGSGDNFVPPMFDFHSIVPAASLRALESALQQQSEPVPRTVFADFQQAVLEAMTTDSSSLFFLHFMTDPECGRMRAYLRNTAPFVNVPLRAVLDSFSATTTTSSSSSSSQHHAKNYFLYCLTYMLCMMTDQEGFGENDDILELAGSKGSRVEEAASGICAALFIRSKLLPAVKQQQAPRAADDGSSEESRLSAHVVVAVYEQLWEMFVAPGVGALGDYASRSKDAEDCLRSVREELAKIQTQARKDGDQEKAVASLVEDTLVDKIVALADELVYDWAANIHPKFRLHKFHEWLCVEMAKVATDETTPATDAVPAMPQGCIKRLLRKADFPVGVTPHKPLHAQADASSSLNRLDTGSDVGTLLVRSNAECAIVFGTSVGDASAADQTPMPGMDDKSNICRYACQSVALDCEDRGPGFVLAPEEIPPTLESYAVVPVARPKPFQKYASESWQSSDGWEVTLVNFIVPRADASSEDGEDASLFGVSLLFQRSHNSATPPGNQVLTEFVSEAAVGPAEGSSLVGFERTAKASTEGDAQPPVLKRRVSVSSDVPALNRRLSEQSWSEQVTREDTGGGASSVTVGLALVSQRNVVLAMRETLTMLLREFSQSPDGDDNSTTTPPAACGALVDVLGTFHHQDLDSNSLKSILEPFIRSTTKPWLERPIGSQKDAFLQLAGKQLVSSLPPIPMALMFVTALLEQKIVLTSSRRSVLFSACTALSELLKPLKWCHLMVPRVPASLAGDLLQYPAPFILGMPSDDPGVMNLVRDLPEDVTLVDLDVGRVILAPSFAHDNELGRGIPNNADTARALRSQVLYLAQSLGGVFGAHMDSETWSSDNPWPPSSNMEPEARNSHQANDEPSQFDRLRSVSGDFVQELLAGTTSCCYWIEEEEAAEDAATSTTTAPTVLFDEDRFFHIKNAREQHGFDPLFSAAGRAVRDLLLRIASNLALSLNDFDLILELFLRCQSMNEYIGSRKRDDMLFSL